MSLKKTLTLGLATGFLVVLGAKAISAQDKNTVKVAGGLGFTDFKGYESWQLVSISRNGSLMAAILGNPTVIDAYRAGIPENGQPFPDGSKMAKVHWVPKENTNAPGPPTVPGTLHDIDFMMKDAKRFADSGGWGFAAFEHDAASDSFAPATTAAKPPQGHDARCGFTCHTKAKASDYVFTQYGKR
ncbi:MAG TPA: cytochrome P460 family protein [Polyangia bacterium]|jgi:hypothetical protein